MTAPTTKLSKSIANVVGETPDYRFYYLSEVLKCPVSATPDGKPLGHVKDLIVKIASPYPQVVGLLIDHGWGKPHEFLPWDRVVRVSPGIVLVALQPDDPPFRPYEDQPGWLLLNEHLMGQTILDIDGRRTKEVNDLHLLESKGRMLLVHVDTSRKHPLAWLGFGRKGPTPDELISWRIFRPLSVEDSSTDTVMLSVTRKTTKFLPGDDLAAALEELKHQDQDTAAGIVPAKLPVSQKFIAVAGDIRMADLFTSLRASSLHPDAVSSVFVIDTDRNLRGVADLSVLALSSQDARVESAMVAAAHSVKDDAPQSEVADIFKHSALRILPVVDAKGRLVGALNRSDFLR